MIDWATNGVALLWKRGTNYHKNGRRFKNARMKYNSSSNIQTMVRLFFSFIFFYHFFFLSPGASDENICDHDGPRGQFYKKKTRFDNYDVSQFTRGLPKVRFDSQRP